MRQASFPSVTRRSFLTAFGGALAGAATVEGLLLEPKRVAVTRHPHGARPEGGATMRIVQLTDLHLGSVGTFEETIAERIDGLDPDVILLTGDSIDDPGALPLLRAFLQLLPTRSERFAVLGNWEYWSGVDLSALARVYARAGCRLLVNETARLSHRGHAVEIVGLDDLVAGTPDIPPALQRDPVGANVLVLSHCPGYRDRIRRQDVPPDAWMLSGHTHGGQIALGRWAPIRPHGSGRYVSGWYRGDGLDLYVSRGLGTSVIPVRLGSVPEIAFFEWTLS